MLHYHGVLALPRRTARAFDVPVNFAGNGGSSEEIDRPAAAG